MAHLNEQILGRNLNGEDRAEILNIAKLTLSNAASAAGEAVRYDEYSVDIPALQTRVSDLEAHEGHIDQVYVDTTSPDLATAIAAGTWDGVNETWTFGSKVLTTGDVLILNAATEQDSDRTWILNGTNAGTVADFTALGSDVDAAIDAAIASLKGDAAAEFDTLGKIEDQIQAQDAAHATVTDGLNTRLTTAESEIDALESAQALRPEFKIHTGTFTQNGSNYELEFANPYNTSAITVSVQSDETLGSWHNLTGLDVDIHVTDSLISIVTASTSVGGHSVRVLMNGIAA